MNLRRADYVPSSSRMLTTVFLSWTTRQPCFLSTMDMEVTLADYIGNSLRPPTPDFNRQEKGSFVLLLSRVELSLIGKKTSRAMLIHSSEVILKCVSRVRLSHCSTARSQVC